MSTSMNRRRFLHLTAAAGAAATVIPLTKLPTARAAKLSPKADMVFLNGSVITVDARRSVTQALAVKDGKITYVGSQDGVRSLINTSTEVVDLAGGALMPGIHDGHAHPIFAGRALAGHDLEYTYFTQAGLAHAVQGFLDETRDQEPDGWLHALRWALPPMKPIGAPVTKAILDGLDTQRPIVVRNSDIHTMLLNSRALQLAGITRYTPDPPDGVIVRDASGEPTGLLVDGAEDLVEQFVRPTFDADVENLGTAIDLLHMRGVTTFGDAWTEDYMVPMYTKLRDQGRLKARTHLFLKIFAQDAGDPEALVQHFSSVADANEGGRLNFGIVKIYADGVAEHPLQTAALLEPYLEKVNGKYEPGSNRGNLYFDAVKFNAVATAFDAAGWQVFVHAIGDATARTALDAFEVARNRNRRADNRHTISHLEMVDPDDYRRFAELGVLANMQLQWAGRDEWTMESLKPYIGDDRWSRLFPARSLRDAGALLTAGSDWPVDPGTPFEAIRTAVTRRYDLAGQYGVPLNPDQALTRQEAIEMHTRNAAYQLHQEGTTGSLEEGKAADLVVVDRDVVATAIDNVDNTVVLRTFVAGETVYDVNAVSTGLQRAASRKLALGAEGHGHH